MTKEQIKYYQGLRFAHALSLGATTLEDARKLIQQKMEDVEREDK